VIIFRILYSEHQPSIISGRDKMPSTKENLKEAFAGESQANQKYRAFAKS
jgi:rubrerythrin